MKCLHIMCNKPAIAGLCHGHLKLLNQEDSLAVVCWECGAIVSILEREDVALSYGKRPELDYKKYIYVEHCPVCSQGELTSTVIKNDKGIII